MLKSIAEDVKREFAFGNKITQLIIVNAAVFVAIQLIRLVYVLIAGFQPSSDFMTLVQYLSLSSDLVFDFTHPWVFISHMFLHVGFWHFLFNMLYLYWFGRIVGDFLGDRRVVPLYLLSGFFGALTYLITAPLLPGVGGFALGASAAVMGIVLAAGAIAPDYIFRLLFIGEVKLKYIVLVLVLLDLIGIASLSNTGGHFAHLGGAAFGWFYVAMLKRGTDLADPVNKFLDALSGIFSPADRRSASNTSKRTIYVRSKKSDTKSSRTLKKDKPKDFQVRLDEILDKIKSSGYDSLTEEEKEFLFQASKRG